VKFTIAIEAATKTSAFGVAVPDLPGCFSAGDTVEEAFDNAREAIEAHCEILAEEEKDLPQPRPMSEWQKDREYKGWTWGIVDVPIERFFLFGQLKLLTSIIERLGGRTDLSEDEATAPEIAQVGERKP
jgi:predicted RNase H-like HicB family nuclease